MSLKNFNEWVKTKKNFMENIDTGDVQQKQPIENLYNKISIAMSNMQLNPKQALDLVHRFIGLISQHSNVQASAIIRAVKETTNQDQTPTNVRNEPTVGGAPGAQGK